MLPPVGARAGSTRPVVLIAGPTASGKSALALALAREIGGTVINADSMQVYDALPILTARPTAADEAAAPHALYGFVPGEEAYSAGRYMRDAAAAIARADAMGRTAIVVGGTGLYFKALTQGLSVIPPVPDAIRTHWREAGRQRGAKTLHSDLAARDPEGAARLKPADTQRIVRALEVLEATGRPLWHWQAEPGVPVLAGDAVIGIRLACERDVLRRRARERLALMLDAGALVEAAALRDRRLAPDRPIMKALGLRPFLEHLAGKTDRATALARAEAETWSYIRRQQTWLRRNMLAFELANTQEIGREVAKIVALIDRWH